MFGLFEKKNFKYICACCGELHVSPNFGYKRPIHFYSIPEAEREELIEIDSDMCIIDPSESGVNSETIYSIRTELLIKINNVTDPLSIGVWVSQSADSMTEYWETFEKDQSDFLSFGWLHLHFPYYKTQRENGEYVAVACDVRGRSEGLRPTLHLQKTDHELYRDQQTGISWKKAKKIANAFGHGDSS